MKKLIYTAILAASAGMFLVSCSSHEEYDAYVASLKSQPAVIDTISSSASYALYLDSLSVRAEAFDQLGIKLDQAQQEEITALSGQIQEALVVKYNQLSTPAAVETPLDSAAQVAPFRQSGCPSDSLSDKR